MSNTSDKYKHIKNARKISYSPRGTNEEFSKWKKRTSTPGMHPNKKLRKPSDYSKMLLERKKLKLTYVIKEHQLKSLVEKIEEKGSVGSSDRLINYLESRIDSVIFRSGIKTKRFARQLVGHGHFLLNDKEIDICSIILRAGDVVTLKELSKEKKFIESAWNDSVEVPNYLSFDKENKVIKITKSVTSSVKELGINIPLIFESYKKKLDNY